MHLFGCSHRLRIVKLRSVGRQTQGSKSNAAVTLSSRAVSVTGPLLTPEASPCAGWQRKNRHGETKCDDAHPTLLKFSRGAGGRKALRQMKQRSRGIGRKHCRPCGLRSCGDAFRPAAQGRVANDAEGKGSIWRDGDADRARRVVRAILSPTE